FFFIPFTLLLNLQQPLITTSLILLHLFNPKPINPHLILNQIILLILPLPIPFLINLIIPTLHNKFNHFNHHIQNQITQIFNIFTQPSSIHNHHLNIKFHSLL
ncbi:aromatic acid exporter family protein, partial [Staphylococcus epidermidis]|uniref:aromatic acid exporter family protein n=1 Tax=Staphylococcus epidermidis TaxID=1282 RepID=UPI0021B2950D